MSVGGDYQDRHIGGLRVTTQNIGEGAPIYERQPHFGEHQRRLVGKRLGDPTPHRSAAEPFVFEQAEQLQVVEAFHVFARIEFERLRLFQPERRAGFGIEVPGDNVAHVSVESLAGLADLGVCGEIHTHNSNAFRLRQFFNVFALGVI